MATKKPYTRHTHAADRKIDEGSPKLRIPPIVKPEHKPVTQPPTDTQPPADTQPAPATPKPEPSGTESTK